MPKPSARKPTASTAGYSGTPLPAKLGIKEGSVVVLVQAPAGFESVLGKLPERATLSRRPAKARDLTIWFVTSRAQLVVKMKPVAASLGGGGLWIAWPKKASGVETDVTENIVRDVGLSVGLVDYKVCAIDATWSGLKFAFRKSPPHK